MHIKAGLYACIILQHATPAGSTASLGGSVRPEQLGASCAFRTEQEAHGGKQHLSPGLSFASSLHLLLQCCVQGILLLDQAFQLAYLPLYDAHFLLQWRQWCQSLSCVMDCEQQKVKAEQAFGTEHQAQMLLTTWASPAEMLSWRKLSSMIAAVALALL